MFSAVFSPGDEQFAAPGSGAEPPFRLSEPSHLLGWFLPGSAEESGILKGGEGLYSSGCLRDFV